MRSSWAVDGLVGIYACGLTIEVAGRNGDPRAAVSAYDEGVAVLSRIWHPAFGARIRLAATAVGAVADNLAETASDDRPALTDAARRLNAEGHAVLTESQDPSGFWGPEGQAWLQPSRRRDAAGALARRVRSGPRRTNWSPRGRRRCSGSTRWDSRTRPRSPARRWPTS